MHLSITRVAARQFLQRWYPSTKTLLVMKLTTILMLITLLQVNAESYAQRITLIGKNQPIETLLKSLEKQSGYHFWYDYDMLRNAGNSTVSVTNVTLEQALDSCFKNKPLTYSIVRKTVVIKPRPMAAPVFEPVADPPVRGRVTDDKGNPLSGVSVVIVGQSGGISTDAKGVFSIEAPPNTKLQFSSIGYEPKIVTIGKQEFITVSLVTASSSLNDVVVVGYGTQQRRNVTSAVSTVSSESIRKQPIAGFDQAIAGQAAGVQVAQRTGTPGGGVSIRVRGTGSISAGNEPLYVIDGFPVQGSYNRDFNPIASINPNDIESIQILKDASSAAIYGSRGSNGVVLITTKRGKSGKPTIQLDSYFGVQQVANKIDMLNAEEYAIYNTEARNNAWVDQGGNASDPNSLRPERYQIPPMFSNPASLGKGTDWQDAVFRSAPIQNYQLSVSGGNEGTRYMVSGGYFKQDGIVLNTGFERYAVRLNLDSKLSDKFHIGASLAPSYSKNDVLPVEDQVFSGGILGSALAMPPTIPVYDEFGNFTTLLGTPPYSIGVMDNPVAIASKIKGGSSAFRTLGNVFAEWELIPNLKLKSSFGIDYFDTRSTSYWPSNLGRNGVLPPIIPQASASSAREFTWLNENTLTYDKNFGGGHHIDALAGYTVQKSLLENASLNATNFPNDLVRTLNAGQITGGSTTISEWSLLSYLARVNYGYKSKYLLTATIRSDGSSRFGANNRWGVFPSASAGWNIINEDFIQSLNFLSDMKLRASYGLAGNNAIGNYSAIGLLSTSRYSFGAGTGALVNGLQPSTITNALLGWEKMRQFNIGFELGLFNRFHFIVDYYEKITSDLLLNVPVPASTGFSTALQNIGKISNSGWEFTLSSKNLTGKFRWTTDFNIAFDRNKVLALGPSGDPIITTSPSFSPQTHMTRIGSPMASFWGYEVIGVYRDQKDVNESPHVVGSVASRPGDLKYRDVNGDGVITAADVTIIGSNIPDYTFGMTNNFSFKNWALSVLIDGAQGVDVLNGSRRNISLVSGTYTRRDVLNRWQSPEQPGDGRTPRANVVPTGGTVSYVSSLLIEDASFLRIRNVNLRYTLPQKLFQKIPLRSASVYGVIQNLHTFTKYRGFNPEQSLTGSNPLTPGVDFNGYPVARAFTLGINLGF